MGCCQSHGRGTQNFKVELLPPIPPPPSHSDSVHLVLIKAHRERDVSRLIPLLGSSDPLRLKFRCKKIEKVHSFVCYLLAASPEQYSLIVSSGGVARMLELCVEDKHALSALYLMAGESLEVAKALLALQPLATLLRIYGKDKQTSLIASLLLGLLAILDPAFAVQVVTSGGLLCALKVYSELHHFEAKRDMLKAMYAVMVKAVERKEALHSGEMQEIAGAMEKSGDLSLTRLQVLVETAKRGGTF